MYFPHSRLIETAQSFLNDCKNSSHKNKEVWFIGIHVRRTNYIDHLNVTEGGRAVSEEYFIRAIDRMEAKLKEEFHNTPQVIISRWEKGPWGLGS